MSGSSPRRSESSREEPRDAEFDTHTRLIEAAGPVFADRGFDGATIREICASAGVNVASVGYHFGDKMGLYREVIRSVRESRERQFPAPEEDACDDPPQALLRLIRTLLSRIMLPDGSSWETQLMMREMQHPTPVFENIVREFFRPLFDRLVGVISRVFQQAVPRHVVEQLALSVVGQCVYYRFGSGVIEILVPAAERDAHYGVESLSRHITAVTLSAADNAALLKQLSRLNLFPE